jgi:hypothetical protein
MVASVRAALDAGTLTPTPSMTEALLDAIDMHDRGIELPPGRMSCLRAASLKLTRDAEASLRTPRGKPVVTLAHGVVGYAGDALDEDEP